MKGIPFLHPSEVAVLDRLLQLGTWYKCFKDFIATYKVAPRMKSEGEKSCTNFETRIAEKYNRSTGMIKK